MRIRIHKTQLFRMEMQTRMPFRYGIATVTRLPHVFLRLQATVDGQETFGIAADHLAPKWFTKNPETSFEADITEMLAVIHDAMGFAVPRGADTVYALWRQLYNAQATWSAQEGRAPLLSNFGTSLVERALIDAVCRATGKTFAQMLHSNELGIELGEIHEQLTIFEPADLLPAAPLPRVTLRHTVGLSDPLTEKDIPEKERVLDGLPQSLSECIQRYGLRHFKIKVGGNSSGDAARLTQVLTTITDSIGDTDWRFSIDGNESYTHLPDFRHFWEETTTDKTVRAALPRLLFIEQPLHRSIALKPEVGPAFASWTDRPPIIIDESDADTTSLPTALSLGYAGTSHKNCKGIFKGIANACLIAHRRRTRPDLPALLTGEDLSNVGPIALPQDLAVQAALGIESVERNGQHYFAGLSALADGIQAKVLQTHPDLYERSPLGFATLKITDGTLDMRSINAAPFGTGILFDPKAEQPGIKSA